ncbi:MAG TPA: SprB repeat-containing protein, partial [Flavobacteriales bacterium]|nr:SprB repeat-containing protein [Flavobacteriales bacterium]
MHRWLVLITAAVTFYAAHAQQLTVTLTGSMHNGSSIPCFGKKVGTITSTVTGGTAPYWYTWSNGE